MFAIFNDNKKNETSNIQKNIAIIKKTCYYLYGIYDLSKRVGNHSLYFLEGRFNVERKN